MGIARRRQSGEGSGNPMGWLTTFNDLITLLMVFFVLLFTMSAVDTKKLQEFQSSLATGLGVMKTGSKTAIGLHPSDLPDIDPGDTYDPEKETEKNAGPPQDKANQLAQRLRQLQDDPGIEVRLTAGGAAITFDDVLLFDFGKSEINPGGLMLLRKIGAELRKVDCPVRVEGHTDNVPIRTWRYPSNWDLSIARAVSVVKHFIAVDGIPPQRLSAVGYGESRPLVPNDTAQHRSKNRRVELVVVMEEQ